MVIALNTLPAGYRLDLEASPSAEVRATLARQINAFHELTVPQDSHRFGLIVREGHDTIVAGVIGVLTWEWLFVEAVWVAEALRGTGVGRELMSQAESHAFTSGCHSAWLDTFQAKTFYESLGYETFGVLEAYPAGQSRWFMRKSLSEAAT